jgi:hypothetical protein
MGRFDNKGADGIAQPTSEPCRGTKLYIGIITIHHRIDLTGLFVARPGEARCRGRWQPSVPF